MDNYEQWSNTNFSTQTKREKSRNSPFIFQGNLEVLMVQLHLKNFPKIAIEVLRRV